MTPDPEPPHYHTLTVDQLYNSLQTTPQGLTPQQAADRLKKIGPNELTKKKKKPLLIKIFHALTEAMTIILIIAALLSYFIIHEPLEAIAILGVVIINTIISLYQEGKAEKAAEELQKILTPQCKVIRDASIELIACVRLNLAWPANGCASSSACSAGVPGGGGT